MTVLCWLFYRPCFVVPIPLCTLNPYKDKMCTLFCALGIHPVYPFIFAGNRDEFLKRPTEPASWWVDQPGVFAGKDLEGGGTWLGISASGKFGTLTNHRDLKNIIAQAPTRGELVANFLAGKTTPENYLSKCIPQMRLYNGFNLLVGQLRTLSGLPEIWYLHNITATSDTFRLPLRLETGVYGLSNGLLNTPWPKVKAGLAQFSTLIQKTKLDPNDFFEMLSDETVYPDEQLPNTGVSLAWERTLSALCIHTPNYGTRINSVIFLKNNGFLTFWERTNNPNVPSFNLKKVQFFLGSPDPLYL